MKTPSVSSMDAASGPVSAASRMMPSPSRIHWMAAPVTKMAPSYAYETAPPASFHPTVVSSPSTGFGQVSPTFMSTNDPVPYVFFVIPGSKHACPNKAACWSPAAPLIGTPSSRSRPSSPDATTPNLPDEGRTSGNAANGTPKRSHNSLDQESDRMSNSIVRDALETSVACTAPFVSFHNSHASIVPSARPGPASTPPSRNSHSNLEAEK